MSRYSCLFSLVSLSICVFCCSFNPALVLVLFFIDSGSFVLKMTLRPGFCLEQQYLHPAAKITRLPLILFLYCFLFFLPLRQILTFFPSSPSFLLLLLVLLFSFFPSLFALSLSLIEMSISLSFWSACFR